MDSTIIKQDKRLLSVHTKLGKDKVYASRIQGCEAISKLYEYEVELFSDKTSIDPAALLGKPIQFKVQTSKQDPKYINGILVKLTSTHHTTEKKYRFYKGVVVPWLWLLTQTKDYRAFQDKSAIDIIEAIFKDFGFKDFKVESAFKSACKKREYCVMYGENHFDFISRLLEEEGGYYYFQHDKNGVAKMVMANNNAAFKNCLKKHAVFQYGSPQEGKIDRWSRAHQYTTGKFTTTDYHYEQPKTKLLASRATKQAYPQESKLEMFDYPGNYQKRDIGDKRQSTLAEAIECDKVVITGRSTYDNLGAGGVFHLDKYPEKSENQDYIVTSIAHHAVDHSHLRSPSEQQAYYNDFTCIPKATKFRVMPKHDKPKVYGVQPAIVVGPEKQEIYTDKLGRIKVKFFWDRHCTKDEKASCWVRVSQAWSGNKWGSLFIPRVGHEVLVQFEDGNPDRPIVIGSVYNGVNHTPYSLPDQKAMSGIKTQTADEKKQVGNELKFNDQKGKELLFIHAQKDLVTDVEHDSKKTVKNDVTLLIEEGNSRTEIKKGKKEVIVKKEILLSVGKSSIKIDADGITISSKNVSINGTSNTKIHGGSVKVTGNPIKLN